MMKNRAGPGTFSGRSPRLTGGWARKQTGCQGRREGAAQGCGGFLIGETAGGRPSTSVQGSFRTGEILKGGMVPVLPDGGALSPLGTPLEGQRVPHLLRGAAANLPSPPPPACILSGERQLGEARTPSLSHAPASVRTLVPSLGLRGFLPGLHQGFPQVPRLLQEVWGVGKNLHC